MGSATIRQEAADHGLNLTWQVVYGQGNAAGGFDTVEYTSQFNPMSIEHVVSASTNRGALQINYRDNGGEGQLLAGPVVPIDLDGSIYEVQGSWTFVKVSGGGTPPPPPGEGRPVMAVALIGLAAVAFYLVSKRR